ncbi:hypothetical protein D3C80_411940 [compost metagenome]
MHPVTHGERRCIGLHDNVQRCTAQLRQVDVAIVAYLRQDYGGQPRMTGVDCHRHVRCPGLAGVEDLIVNLPGQQQVRAVAGLENLRASDLQFQRHVQLFQLHGMGEHEAAPAQANHIADGLVLVMENTHLDPVAQMLGGHGVGCDLRGHQALVPGFRINVLTAGTVQFDQHTEKSRTRIHRLVTHELVIQALGPRHKTRGRQIQRQGAAEVAAAQLELGIERQAFTVEINPHLVPGLQMLEGRHRGQHAEGAGFHHIDIDAAIVSGYILGHAKDRQGGEVLDGHCGCFSV